MNKTSHNQRLWLDAKGRREWNRKVVMMWYGHPPNLIDPDEWVNWEIVIPWHLFLPLDYQFKEEPLLVELLERKNAGTLKQPVSDFYWLDIELTSAINSASEFWFKLDRHAEMNKQLVQNLGDFFGGTAENETPPGIRYLIPSQLLRERMAVVVYTQGCFYRAYVTHIFDDYNCQVFLVDYGQRRIAFKKDCHYLPLWLKDIPVFAYRGKVAGVQPLKGPNWTESEISLFKDIVTKKWRKYKAIIRYFTTDGKAALWMWNDKIRSVDKELISRGAAKADRTPFKELPDCASNDNNQEMAIIDQFYMDFTPNPEIFVPKE